MNILLPVFLITAVTFCFVKATSIAVEEDALTAPGDQQVESQRGCISGWLMCDSNPRVLAIRGCCGGFMCTCFLDDNNKKQCQCLPS
uniref:U25-Deinotoxin-Dsu1a_4 n=1 Tax=Deinopis subrufa TaxID=1905329 RepID=A0A4Q8KDK9_DEISU